MECENKIKFALAVVSLGAISLLLTAQYRRRRKLKCPPSSCYLQSDHSKPQLSFKRVLADNSFSQFKHQKLGVTDSGNDSCLNSHPYEAEIAALIDKPAVELQMNSSMDLEMSDSYVWVETESQLRDLADVLSKQSVFAVDTEQHSLRSFQGFTALIQISTGMEDYLVDAIALHDRMSILGPVFANPSICKVFHGADNDVLWLQRDFHIYVVNLFDTAKACEVLSKPQKSLAYLLEAYCGVATNKSLQREDWRQRPLSAEMLQYARTDAHYLLYIAGCLIAELKPQDNDNSSCPDDKFRFVAEASRRSHMICLQLYAKEIEVFPGESAASSIISRHLNGQGGSSMLSDTQDLVRRLCMWRELMAHVHDESLRYVLSDQAIASLSVKDPTSQVEIYDTVAQADLNLDPLNSISSLSSPSPVVCSHMDNLHHLIHDKESDLNGIFSVLLQKCLGPNGSCPLSVYNYALLVNNGPRITNKLIPTQNGNQRQIARKASRELFVQKFSCKAPVYHNCRIYANDGRLLCYCDRRKLEWYLRRNLAKLVDDNPPAIMLLFEPKGRPEDEDNDFYIQSKKNICVGCGEGSHYLRYRIIPSCYRMHFPEHLKSHRSHDIVLLCVDCHEIAHAAAEKYKRQIAADFGVPLFVRKVVDSNEAPIITEPSSSVRNAEETGVSPLQLRTAAMALLRHGQRMPPRRRNELKQVVMQYYGGREISEEDLERALLVGMSPHERRRLQKKRGLAFKHSTGRSIFLDGKPVNVSHKVAESAAEDTSAVDLNGSNTTVAIANCRKIDEDYITATDSGLCDPCTDIEMNGIICATACKSKSDACEVSDTQDLYAGKTDDKYEKSPPNGLPDLSHDRHDVSISSKSNLSLLGHGPHGKQVVAHILREYGEDGIGQFCQRWRQVFVEAINPRFLPAGWNVMHSGRREFGEFSVYNPAKRTFGAKIELMHSVTGMDSLDHVT